MGHFKINERDLLQWASKTYPGLLCGAEAGMVWRLLGTAIIAQKRIDGGDKSDFYTGKIVQARYFADVTLPLLQAHAETFMRPGREVIEMPEAAF